MTELTTTDLSKSRQSQVIEWLRFILACLVVILHATGKGDLGSDAYSVTRVILGKGICRIAVPTFFLISGYLFFNHLTEWDLTVWQDKIKRRCRSLLLPYLLWNAIAFFAFFFYALVRAKINGETPVSLPDFFHQQKGWWMFWDNSNGSPIDYPLWFIRDLFLFDLATPIIYLLIKNLRFIGILSIYIVHIFSGVIPEGLCYFALGAFLQVKGKGLTDTAQEFRIPAFLITITLLPILGYTHYLHTEAFSYIQKLFILAGTFSILIVADDLLRRGWAHVSTFLAKSSFFVFAMHGILVLDDISWFLATRLFLGMSFLSSLGDLLFRTTFTIVVCLGLYYLLRRVAPTLASILTGARS